MVVEGEAAFFSETVEENRVKAGIKTERLSDEM